MLSRKTPLRQGDKPLKRGGFLRRVSERKAVLVAALPTTLTTRPRPTISVPARRNLTKRSGGVCEMQLPGCTGAAIDACHRISRGMGGRHGAARVASERLADLMHGCRLCHQWTHQRPAEAYEVGLMLREGQDPTVEPVLYRGRMVLLTDAGGVTEIGEGKAA